MKLRLTLLATALLVGVTSTAQNMSDALRYSTDQISGSARVRAMSGAFGSLGGDISAISINPAGSAIFLTSEAGFTLGNFNTQNNSNFFGTATSDSRDQFDISQGGVVFTFKNTNNKSDWKRISIGINYENSANYTNSNFIAGINPNNGIDKYFLANAEGTPTFYFNADSYPELDNVFNDNIIKDYVYQYLGENDGFAEQQGYLGYQAFIINPLSDDENNASYTSNALYNSLDQQYTVRTKGANRKFTLNFSGQYKDWLYLGANLNFHTIDFSKYTYLSEIGFDEDSPIQETGFENNLDTYGNGFSLQVGAIAKPTQNLRLGLSYQSPTWYRLNDELTQGVFGVVMDEEGNYNEYSVYPNVVNIYETYKLTTPGKATGSISYIFGKSALLSFDYTRKDYSNAKLKPENDALFRSENNKINSLLTTTNAYRIGGEYRIERFSLRGGYRFEESPYKDEATVGDLEGYSFGIGYNFGATTIDISYENAKQKSQYQLYDTGLTDRAAVNSEMQNIMFTMNFKL